MYQAMKKSMGSTWKEEQISATRAGESIPKPHRHLGCVSHVRDAPQAAVVP